MSKGEIETTAAREVFPLGERGPGDHVRYTDPAFGIGATHWPKPLPHERALSLSNAIRPAGTPEVRPPGDALPSRKVSGDRRPPVAAPPRPQVKAIGPTTADGFIDAARKAGVLDLDMQKYFQNTMSLTDVGEGMRRMRCGNRLRNAINRAQKEAV